MVYGDLHVHTSVSDCSMTAEEILRLAVQKGITHIAFTDHDTTVKAKEHIALAAQYGICAVPAIEISAFDHETGKKAHILGYGYRTNHHIRKLGDETLKRRDSNCRKQIVILQELGYTMDLEKIEKLSDTSMYKQHILDYLVQTGQEKELFGEVYRNVFKNGGPCDFDIRYPSAVDAVKAVKADGGYAVLAHPGQQQNFYLVPELVRAGLDGIERNHPANSRHDRGKIDQLCRVHWLFATGGSDFHGSYGMEKTGLGGERAPVNCPLF